jgi:hypothetical protein
MEIKKKKLKKGGGYGVKRGDAVSCPQVPVLYCIKNAYTICHLIDGLTLPPFRACLKPHFHLHLSLSFLCLDIRGLT